MWQNVSWSFFVDYFCGCGHIKLCYAKGKVARNARCACAMLCTHLLIRTQWQKIGKNTRIWEFGKVARNEGCACSLLCTHMLIRTQWQKMGKPSEFENVLNECILSNIIQRRDFILTQQYTIQLHTKGEETYHLLSIILQNLKSIYSQQSKWQTFFFRNFSSFFTISAIIAASQKQTYAIHHFSSIFCISVIV